MTTARSEVQFDVVEPLAVSKVVLDGKTVGAMKSGEHLIVKTGAIKADSRYTVSITYAGTGATVGSAD